MLNNFLCAFGIHKWGKWELMSPLKEYGFSNQERECQKCGRKEIRTFEPRFFL